MLVHQRVPPVDHPLLWHHSRPRDLAQWQDSTSTYRRSFGDLREKMVG